jgi:hypothetical protein
MPSQFLYFSFSCIFPILGSKGGLRVFLVVFFTPHFATLEMIYFGYKAHWTHYNQVHHIYGHDLVI